MNKILLLGADGQVGWELQRSLAVLGDVYPVRRSQLDLAEQDRLRALVRSVAPQAVVNAAAYTAVDKAESDSDHAMSVNGSAAGVLAEEARDSGALLVHYSTDYVFDGTRSGAYTERDAPNPLSVYGRTKLAGERAIQESGCRHLVFRTSWVYSLRGANFAKTILRLAAVREALTVVDDQVGAPTSAELLADVTAICVALVTRAPASHACGLYHVAPAGETSWHAYAKFLVASAAEAGMPLKLSPAGIEPTSTDRYGAPAKRPLNSRLDTSKLRSMFGIALPDWQTHVSRLIAELSSARTDAAS